MGYKTLAKNLKISESKAKKIIAAYWKRNWAITEFVERELKKTVVKLKERKKVDGMMVNVEEMWVQSPLNKFYYRVRGEKDLFSAVNQSSGAYLFDKWLGVILKKYPKLAAQFHDEIILIVPKGYRERISIWLSECMEEVNKTYNLNTPLKVKSEFGDAYSDIH